MNKQQKVAIDPAASYTLGEIVRNAFIPDIDNIPKAARLMVSDQRGDKILNASLEKRGARGIMYQVQGKNLIRYIASRQPA